MKGLIVGFVSDIMFQTRIEIVAEKLGVKVQWFDRADQVNGMDVENTLFVESVVLDHIIQIEPQLIIFDLGDNSVPWEEWITLLKKHPEMKLIPVVCFGSHVDVDTFKIARQTGANEVLARSRFVTVLPKLIQRYVNT